MEIYLVRHATAEPRREGLLDEDRALTRKGEKKARRALRGLTKIGVGLDRVLSSPLVRAWQTAKLLASELETDGPRVEAALSPGGEPRVVLERLASEAPDARIALVGHQPGLGELATWLVAVSGSGLELGKAGVARLDFEATPAAGKARLVWLLTPLLLRRLAR